MDELINKIEIWADQKGILKHASIVAQSLKTQEEAAELCGACSAYAALDGLDKFINLKNEKAHFKSEIADAIGDIFVTIVIQAKLNNLNFEVCVRDVLDIIEKRTGKMINGKFVKD